jgi:aminoglycoside/choline kinase family phosphotransferase
VDGLAAALEGRGIFARLTYRDGKPKYVADTPRFIGYARAVAARYAPLGPLVRILDELS